MKDKKRRSKPRLVGLDFLKSRPASTALIFLAGLLSLFLLRIFITSLPAESGNEPYLGAWLRLWVFVVFAACALVVYRVKDQELLGELLAGLLGLFFAGLVLLVLKETSFALNGVEGDQGLLTAQVTKFASYPGAVDFAYKDLPPFYPPLTFFVLGKTAALFGIEPYRMLKYGLIAIVFILPFLTRRLWSRIHPAAFSLAAILSLLFFQEWYKPFEWLSLVLFVPWWLHFVDGVGTNHSKPNLGWLALGSLVGGLLFSTYYYWFFIGGLSLAIRFLLRNVLWAAGENKSADGVSRFLVLAGAALVSSPYWGPMLLSMWRTGGWVSLQNKYFILEFNVLPFPFFQLSISGLLMLGGLAYLVHSYRRNAVSYSLLVLIIAAYAWQVLGYAFFLLQTPLLTFKARDFVVYVLSLAGVLGAAELLMLTGRNTALRKKLGGLVVSGLVLLSLFYGQLAIASFSDKTLLTLARRATYPQEVIDQYETIVSDQALHNRVVLADRIVSASLGIFTPVFQFLPWAAVYSHPAGVYYERVEFLELLSTAGDPVWFAAALMNNRYDHIDEIILFPRRDNFILGYLPDNFPNIGDPEDIVFPGQLLDPAFFSRTDLGDYVVFSPIYAANPLVQLPAPETYDSADPIDPIGDGDDMFQFLKRFQGHLSFAGMEEYWSKLSAEFGP